MASNKKLTEDIGELAAGLGLDIETNGLNNEELAVLLSDLRAKKRDAELQTLADDAEAKAAEEAAEEAAEAKAAEEAAEAKAAEEAAEAKAAEAKAAEATKAPRYYVVKGKAITSKRGILSDGDEVKAGDLSGGGEVLAKLLEIGLVDRG